MTKGLHNADSKTLSLLTESELLARVPGNPGIWRRFDAKVNRSGGSNACWLWTGCQAGGNHGQPYGTLLLGGRSGRPVYVHRIAWVVSHGSIPSGLSVLHSCDTPLCVNPDHLFLGTHLDNMRDASAKGRLSVARPNARKVTDAQIAEMFALRADGWKLVRIADRFNVTKSYVSLVLSGSRRRAPRKRRAA